MSTITKTTYSGIYPTIPVTGIVAYPSVPISFEVSDEDSVNAAEAAFKSGQHVFICAIDTKQKHKPLPDSLYRVGTISKIKQSIKTPEGNMRLITEGCARARVIDFYRESGYYSAEVAAAEAVERVGNRLSALAFCRALHSSIDRLSRLLPPFMTDMVNTIREINDPAMLADFIASGILVKQEDKQSILESFRISCRVELLLKILEREISVMECENEIQAKVRAGINQNQREFYLREQMKVIREELGMTDDEDEYRGRIESLDCPQEVKDKLNKELDRMSKAPFGSPEASVIRSYIEVCLDIPWGKTTKDRINVERAKKILDADHDGMEKVKDRILEFLAVKKLAPTLKNQILCLVGPPGVGKTSVAASIARAMNRKYVRVSLGGVRDEADIRGHRKTYLGSMPGRIIDGLIRAEVKNPLMLLDEVDKLTSDAHGDPSSALLEVLDSEQNHAFRDHFVEMPVDLSECLFIATANTLDTIPRPLLDRMEIIELKTYTKTEKIAIARNHLIGKQLSRHGLTRRMLSIDDGALSAIIDGYTRESGVRSLERRLAEIARGAARRLVEDPSQKSIKLTAENLAEFLGPVKILPERIDEEDRVGVVNGLAYTESGGDVLKVEVAVMEGTGVLELTGSLGEVMKESAKIARSLVRSMAGELGIDPTFYKTKDIHIHFPEGAVPKDGPSAGVTMASALVSALTERPARRDVAMTGEISLRGRVMAIGGLREKTMAAYTYGVRRVLIPADNMRELDELDRSAREGLTFVPCATISDVLREALLPAPPAAPTICKEARESTKERSKSGSIPARHPASEPARSVFDGTKSTRTSDTV